MLQFPTDNVCLFCFVPSKSWVGNNGSGGNPSSRTTHGSSFWACQTDQEVYQRQGSSFNAERCGGQFQEAGSGLFAYDSFATTSVPISKLVVSVGDSNSHQRVILTTTDPGSNPSCCDPSGEVAQVGWFPNSRIHFPRLGNGQDQFGYSASGE